MANQLQQAIDHLSNRYGMDWYPVVKEFAKRHPTSFNRVMRDLAKMSWEVEALQQSSKIEAIKHVRSHTGWSLKQAKDWVDERWPHQPYEESP